MADRERATWRRHFRLLGRADLRADVDDELAHHLDLHARDLAQRGYSAAAARDEAARRFGDASAIRAECLEIDDRVRRRTSRKETLMTLMHDLRLTARALRRSRGFTSVAVACLAIGVAVTATIFGAANSLLVRPLPYRDADRLVAIYGALPARDARGINISFWDYQSWRQENRTFADIGIWSWSTITVSSDKDAERVQSALVSANLFSVLGVAPILGRHFTPAEERAGADRVILLSYGLWQRRYGGERDIIGKTIRVNALPYTVIGVMPPDFKFPEIGEAWRPLPVESPNDADRGNRFYAGAIGRLKDGVTLQSAKADLERIMRNLEATYPNDYRGWSADPITLRDDVVGVMRRLIFVFLGAVGMVLLIICANVANLMLARGAERRREIGIRVALGAGRGRVVRHVLLESVIIAAAGGMLGTLLVPWGLRLFLALYPGEVPFYFRFGLDGTVIAFILLISLLSGFLLGLVPALRAANVDVGSALKEGSRGQAGGRQGSRLRDGLVVAELALSVMLLVGATLLIRSYRVLTDTHLGFDEKGLLAVRVSLPSAEFPEFDRRRVYWESAYQRLSTLPGVEVVGSAEGIPFSGWNVQSQMSIDGRPAVKGHELDVHYQNVSPDYFRAIGAPIVRGRGLTTADRDSGVYVGVANEELVRREFAGQDPIGKRIRWGDDPNSTWPWITIVGVVRDFRHWRLPAPMQPAIYLSQLARPSTSQTIVLRTKLANPRTLEPAVRAALRDLNNDAPAYQVQTFEQVVSISLWRQRMQGQVLGVFAVMAMLLAAIGIYGVISYAVAQRTREMGVRMALGAKRSQVAMLVLRQGTRLAFIGVGIGITGALLLRGTVAQLLYGIAPTDPLTFVAVPLSLAVVAILASVLPAQRATRVDPVVAMKAD
ncbi:MAG TPA: ABC transporter permease [Gemmatimonadaceae bacterium]